MISPHPRALPITKLVARVHHSTLEIVEQGADIEDRLLTRATIDRQSDAKFAEALRWFRLCRVDPENARHYAVMGEAALAEGLRLDALEDGPCAAAVVSAVSVQDIGRDEVLEIDRYWGVKGLPGPTGGAA